MKRLAEQYFQYNQKFISLTLDHATISKNSEVLVYGDSKYGYQREVNKLHLNRMISTLKAGKELLSPTSILLGVSPDQVNRTLEPIEVDNQINSQEKIYLLDISKINFKFRIIDGQHRIRAFDEVLKDENINESLKEKLKEYIFNVIIVVIPEDERIQEVELFRTINSKAKPLKTDLAMLAKYNYEVMYEEHDIDYKNHIKTRIIFYLNDEELHSEFKSCWVNGIKVDVNDPRAIGSVGFKAFGDSIDKIVSIYMKLFEEKFKDTKYKVTSLDKGEKYKYIDELLEKSTVDILKNIIIPAWEIIYKKWNYAFREELIDNVDEKSKKYYDRDFYIQQTMGVKAINGLLAEIYEKHKDFNNTIQEFEKIINQSSLTEDEWRRGDNMKGLSSESGFRIIREMIKS